MKPIPTAQLNKSLIPEQSKPNSALSSTTPEEPIPPELEKILRKYLDPDSEDLDEPDEPERCHIKRIKIAGAFAYNANYLIEIKRLKRGSIVKLFRERSNLYDPNAIAVYFENEKIGFVPKNQNNKVTEEQMAADRWKIFSIKKTKYKNNTNYEIHCFDTIASARRPKAPKSTSSNKFVIYRITINGFQYHGSTTNFSRRKAEHIRNLKSGSHHNEDLQRAYDRSPAAITFRIIKQTADIVSMKKIESTHIRKANNKRKSNQIEDTSYNPKNRR